MRDKITNFLLSLTCYFRYILKIKSKNNIPINVEHYKLTFFDFFLDKTLDRKKWSIGQTWGDFHPQFLHQYYGTTSEFINLDNGCLNLYSHYKPIKFYDFKNNINITIPYGVGLIRSNQIFNYGYFEIKAILPRGKWLWPTLRLSNSKTLSPEIYILEGCSKSGNYENSIGLKNFNFQSNIRCCQTNDNKTSFNTIKYPINYTDNKLITFGLNWTKNSIEIYCDGYKVFQIKDKKTLKYFNTEENEMEIILNNSLESIAAKEKLHSSVFKIRSVKYYQFIS